MINYNYLLLSAELLLVAPSYGDFQSIHQEWLGTFNSLICILSTLNEVEEDA